MYDVANLPGFAMRTNRWMVGVLVITAGLPPVLSAQGRGGGRGGQGALSAYTPVVTDPRSQIPPAPNPSTIRDGFTFAAAGDMIGPGIPILPTPDSGLERIANLFRNADVGFANNEGAIFDLAIFGGYPAAQHGGGYPVAAPGVAKDLKAMGITVVSKANNHAFDFGIEGLRATERVLQEAGVAHAGSGNNRALARAPVFIQTPKGRVSVVAAASSFNPASVASMPGETVNGRPGISVLRTTRINLATQEEMNALAALIGAQGGRGARGASGASGASPNPGQLSFGGQRYRLSEKRGVTYEMNPVDQFEIYKAIRGAKQMSDLTVFTIHAHESGGVTGADHTPADFLPTLFHDAVDAGADIVVGHGPHYLRGIEIYKGKPIFYGLNSLFFQMETLCDAFPDVMEQLRVDARPVTCYEDNKARFGSFSNEFFESVVAVSEFEDAQVNEIRLYPIDLRADADVPGGRGIPRPASPAMARRILEELQKQSSSYGTRISIENSVGFIRVPRVPR